MPLLVLLLVLVALQMLILVLVALLVMVLVLVALLVIVLFLVALLVLVLVLVALLVLVLVIVALPVRPHCLLRLLHASVQSRTGRTSPRRASRPAIRLNSVSVSSMC